jgi:hypothetical protein
MGGDNLMVQRLALPLAVTPGRGMVTVEQDSPAEVAQSVGLLLATRPGDRRSVPEYGTPNFLGDGLDPDDVAAALEAWEDRANPAGIVVDEDGEFQRVEVYPAEADRDDEPEDYDDSEGLD